MIDLKCSLDVRESGARLGFVHGSTMGVDELLVKLKCRIPVVRNRFDRFARGLLFTGRPLFLCRDNRKILHCQPVLLFDPTVVAQYLPLVLVAQQMARLMG